MLNSILGLTRDVLKGVYLLLIQLQTRLFYLNREMTSSISLSARLDVIPRGGELHRHRLVLKKDTLIEKHCVINTWHGDIILEEGATIGIGSIIIGPVIIGRGSVCAQHCFIAGQSHQYKDVTKNFRRQGFDIKPITIGEDVWICSNSVVLPGVTIGNKSVIGAGSVVSKDVAPFSLAVGNPAKVVKQYDFGTRQWQRI
jgi:acetyltransferase-like isoleucine patch superfamily enzyme